MKVELTSVEQQAFKHTFDELIYELVSCPDFKDIPKATDWISAVINHTVPHGKKIRGIMTVLAVRKFSKDHNDPKLIRKSHILGWCCELLQAGGLIADDIIDEAVTRRGRPCWHKYIVGGGALNDAFILENVTFRILRAHFKNESYYMELVDLTHDILLKTFMGQCLDINASKDSRAKAPGSLSSFTKERYEKIVKYKTCYYTFVMPVFLALTMSGFKDETIKNQIKEILLLVGFYFQAQDDFLDCFGNEKLLGKKGTDISEGKCTWVVVKAIEKASPEQLSILEKHYGQCQVDSKEATIVKNIFEELDIPLEYKLFESDMYQQIHGLIDHLPSTVPHDFFIATLQFLSHRTM